MDVYAAIKHQHDAARDTLEKLGDSTTRAVKTRKFLFDAFKRDLWAHNKVEEAVFYSVLRNHKEVRDEALEAFAEHHMLNALLEELETTPVDNDNWTAKFSALSELLEHHMKEEEDEVFNMARNLLSTDDASDMGKKLQSRHRVIVAALEPVAEP